MVKLLLPEYKVNYECLKATVAANFNKFECDRVTSTNSQSKLPTFQEDGKAQSINESNAVAKCVGGDLLWGETIEEKALIYQWVEFADQELNPYVCAWCFPYLSLSTYNQREIEQVQKKVYRSLLALDTVLMYKVFLVGDRITQADINCASALYLGFKVVLGNEWQSCFPNVTRWFLTMVNQPEFLKELNESSEGGISLCKKTPMFDMQQFMAIKKILEHPSQTAAAITCVPSNQSKYSEETSNVKKLSNDVYKSSLKEQIIAQGAVVRQLKTSKASKVKVKYCFPHLNLCVNEI